MIDKIRKNKILFRIIIYFVLVSVATAGVFFYVLRHKNAILVTVSVTAYKVSSSDHENEFLRENIDFNQNDLNLARSTSSVNMSMENDASLKFVYNVFNKDGGEYNYKLEIPNVKVENCKLTYAIDDGEFEELDSSEIKVSTANDFKITLFVRIDEAGLDCGFVGDFMLSISRASEV